MTQPNFDSEALNLLIEPDNRETRSQWRTLVEDPLFKPVYNVSLEYSRELAFARLKKISEAKVMSIFDFEKNPKRIFAGHEMCGFIDGSLATKMTVQWNLFGGTAHTFHTDYHREVLEGIDSMKYVGCFC
jgi:acyl-CoA oxidase